MFKTGPKIGDKRFLDKTDGRGLIKDEHNTTEAEKAKLNVYLQSLLTSPKKIRVEENEKFLPLSTKDLLEKFKYLLGEIQQRVYQNL